MNKKLKLRLLARAISRALHSKVIAMHPGDRWRFSLAMMLEVAQANAEGIEVNVDYLRAHLGFTQASTSRKLKSHLAAGTLETYETSHDGRKTYVRLSELGQSLIDDILSAMK